MCIYICIYINIILYNICIHIYVEENQISHGRMKGCGTSLRPHHKNTTKKRTKSLMDFPSIAGAQQSKNIPPDRPFPDNSTNKTPAKHNACISHNSTSRGWKENKGAAEIKHKSSNPKWNLRSFLPKQFTAGLSNATRVQHPPRYFWAFVLLSLLLFSRLD